MPVGDPWRSGGRFPCDGCTIPCQIVAGSCCASICVYPRGEWLRSACIRKTRPRRGLFALVADHAGVAWQHSPEAQDVDAGL